MARDCRCVTQVSVEKVANLSLTSYLSQLGRLSSRQVVGYSHSVVAEMVSYLFVHQHPQLVTPVSELDNQGARLISATSAIDPVCLLNVGCREGYCQLSCLIQNINYILHTGFIRLLCCLWQNADKFQIFLFSGPVLSGLPHPSKNSLLPQILFLFPVFWIAHEQHCQSPVHFSTLCP